MKRSLLAACFLLAVTAAVADPQTTAFTYQGNLTANGAPANGNFDLTFSLFDAATGGNPVGAPIVMTAFPVVNGRFTTDLDFPSAFAGEQRWVEVSVGAQVLSPRQPVNSVPAAQVALACCSPSTYVVSAGADTQQNGTKLIATLNTIAALTPSASKLFLVKLEPGNYDVGTTPLQLLSYVQIEGAGEGITQITGAGQASPTSGVVLAANNTELRKLSVQSRSGDNYSTAIYIGTPITGSFSIDHVTVQVAGGIANGTGIYNNGSPLIDGATIAVTNATTNGLSIGILNTANAAQIRRSSIQAQTTGTGTATGISSSSGATPLISDVQINVSTTGVPVNNLSPDAIGINSDASNPSVRDSTLSAATTGGGSGVGVVLNNSSTALVTATFDNVRVVANSTGAAFIQGILDNTAGGNPVNLVVRNSSIAVTGSNKTNCQAFGVDSFGAPVAVYNTTIDVSVGTGCLAGVGLILQGGPNDMTFNNGSVKSSQYAIYNSNFTAKVKVGASQLNAPITVSGGAACISSYKSDYTATTSTCN